MVVTDDKFVILLKMLLPLRSTNDKLAVLITKLLLLRSTYNRPAVLIKNTMLLLLRSSDAEELAILITMLFFGEPLIQKKKKKCRPSGDM